MNQFASSFNGTRTVLGVATALGLILNLATFAGAEPPASKDTPAAQPTDPAAERKANVESLQKVVPPQIAQTLQPAANPQQPASTVQLKPGEAPQVEFDTPIYDFGRIRAGDPVEHTFWFHNKGNGPLEITNVRPACGCTTAGAFDRIVEPGKSGKIPIRLNTGKTSGPIAKTVTVTTNVTGPNSMITLQIKGTLWQPVETVPNMASFGNVTTSQLTEKSLERRLTIVNNMPDPIELKDIKSTAPDFKAEVKAIEAGKKYELIVSLGQVTGQGVKAGSITMNTGLKDMPSLQVPVNAYVVADVDVIPRTLTLPQAASGMLQREIYVRNNGKKPLKISDLAASNPSLKVNLMETQPGTSFSIKLEIPEKFQVAAKGEQIKFKTDHPAFPEVTIPIVASNYTPPVSAPPAAVVPATAQKPAAAPAKPATKP